MYFGRGTVGGNRRGAGRLRAIRATVKRSWGGCGMYKVTQLGVGYKCRRRKSDRNWSELEREVDEPSIHADRAWVSKVQVCRSSPQRAGTYSLLGPISLRQVVSHSQDFFTRQ